MATDSGELAIQILKRQGKKETGKDFKENFEFLIKDYEWKSKGIRRNF